MRRHFWLKSLGITAFMCVFFVGYFHVLRHPVRAVVLMPLTALDQWIEFAPSALLAYVSLWVYVGIAPMLIESVRALLRFGLWIGALCAVGLACFYLWPTAVPPQTLNFASHAAFAVLQGVDAAGNACPSLHVATAVFSALWVDRLLAELAAGPRWRWLNAAWLLLIAYSTLAIKQHVLLDVLAGAVLGLVFAWLSLPRQRSGQAATIMRAG